MRIYTDICVGKWIQDHIAFVDQHVCLWGGISLSIFQELSSNVLAQFIRKFNEVTMPYRAQSCSFFTDEHPDRIEQGRWP